MAIVETPQGLDSGPSRWPMPTPSAGLTLYNGRTFDYAALYRAQPNVRLVVRFIARNVAQVPLKGFRRIDEANREPLPPGHELRDLIDSPFSSAPKPPSRFRFMRTLVEDLATYDRYYALFVRHPTTGRLNLVRVPPTQMVACGSSLVGVTSYKLTVPGSDPIELAPEDVFHLAGHDPGNPLDGVSSLEALRSILAEDVAAGDYRHQMWTNAARVSGVIERPETAPKWGTPARNRFSEEWRAAWSGVTQDAGGTPILEEGMKFTPTGFTAQETEYLGARKLTREECAAAYFIPPAFVGITEGATFASLKEFRTSLYVDTLGPWFEWITGEWEAQVLPQVADSSACYVDFSVDAKLAGSFEEQAASLSTATGRPWLLTDEARSRLNLAPLPDGQGQQIVTPLNVLVGGLASPRDTAPPLEPGLATAHPGGQKDHRAHTKGALPSYLLGWEAKHAEVLRGFFESQRSAVLGSMGAGGTLATAFDSTRWNEVLSDRLFALGATMTEELGTATAEDLGGTFDTTRTTSWLRENARIAAESINAATLNELAAAAGQPRAASRPAGAKLLDDVLADLDGLDLLDDETPDDPTDPWPSLVNVFALAVSARAAQLAVSRVTSIGQWARREGAEQAGAGTKTWNVNANPSRHAALAGETVPIRSNFSNGAAWPGDPVLGAAENAGCLCSLTFGT